MGGGPLPGGPGGPGGPPMLVCDTPQCQTALADLVVAKRQVIAQCAIVETAKTTLYILGVLAIVMFVIAASLVAAAVGFFLAFNFLEGAATIAAAAALLVAALQFLPKIAAARRLYQTQLTVLNDDRSNFSSVAKEVLKNCPQGCTGDLSIPACPD